MPEPKPRDQWTADDYREATIEARRQARYRFAADRIRKIVAGSPPLTDAQKARLAVLLNGGAGLAGRSAEARRGGDAA
jgi:hypothetical protein